MKLTFQGVIPVDCMLLSTGTDASQLQTSVWPQSKLHLSDTV
jgi:hypothetical protein